MGQHQSVSDTGPTSPRSPRVSPINAAAETSSLGPQSCVARGGALSSVVPLDADDDPPPYEETSGSLPTIAERVASCSSALEFEDGAPAEMGRIDYTVDRTRIAVELALKEPLQRIAAMETKIDELSNMLQADLAKE